MLLSSGTETAGIDSNLTAADPQTPCSTDSQSSDTAGQLGTHGQRVDGQGVDDAEGETMKVVQSQLDQLNLGEVSTSRDTCQSATSEASSMSAPLVSPADQLSSETTPISETLIDRLYAVTSEGKHACARSDKKNRETYLYRRTAKVCVHLNVNAIFYRTCN